MRRLRLARARTGLASLDHANLVVQAPRADSRPCGGGGEGWQDSAVSPARPGEVRWGTCGLWALRTHWLSAPLLLCALRPPFLKGWGSCGPPARASGRIIGLGFLGVLPSVTTAERGGGGLWTTRRRPRPVPVPWAGPTFLGEPRGPVGQPGPGLPQPVRSPERTRVALPGTGGRWGSEPVGVPPGFR